MVDDDVRKLTHLFSAIRTTQPLRKLKTDEGPVSTECAPYYLAASLRGIHLQSAKSRERFSIVRVLNIIVNCPPLTYILL